MYIFFPIGLYQKLKLPEMLYVKIMDHTDKGAVIFYIHTKKYIVINNFEIFEFSEIVTAMNARY